MKRYLVAAGALSFVAFVLMAAFAADAPKPDKLQVKDEWFTPVALRLNGIEVSGFIYNGPGQFIVQNQKWAKVKAMDPIEELTPQKPVAPKPVAPKPVAPKPVAPKK